jgi:glyoxylase-like metal-dependent hydrolase (beta-lactamase superfamily II)
MRLMSDASAGNGKRGVPRFARGAVMVALGVAMAVAAGMAQQPKPEAPMRIEKVKDGLYLVRGPFHRCAPNGCGGGYGDDGFLHEAGDVAVRVTAEGLIVVDNKYDENVADVLAQIKSVSTQPIRYVLNTHHHTDHAGGDATFIKTTEIIAHRNVRENFLRNKQPGAPRVVFGNDASVFLGGVEVRAYHFGRAHTNGDAVIHFPDLRVIHTGDLITEGMPVMDYRNGASAVEWVSVLDKVLELDFDVVIPGHGPLMTKAQVKADRDKLARMNERMAALVRQGVPKENVFAQLGLADLGWDRTVSTVAFTGGLSGYYDEMQARIGK